MSDTPRVMSDDRGYPLPEHTQHIVFEGADCVVMAPEDYEALFGVALSLERELTATRQRVAELEDALRGLQHADGCYCEAPFVMPRAFVRHSDECEKARAALRKETP